MTKKLLILVILTAALITLTACGTADDPATAQTEAESVYEIAVSQEPDPSPEIGASSNGGNTIDETIDEPDVAGHGQETVPLDYQYDDGQETVPLDYQHDDEQAVIYTYVRDTDYVVTIYDRPGEAAQIPYRFPEPFLEWFTGGVRMPERIISAMASLVSLDVCGTQGLIATRDEVQDGLFVSVGRIFYLRYGELSYKDIGTIGGGYPMNFTVLTTPEGRLVISGTMFGRWSYTLLAMQDGNLIYDFTLLWDNRYGYYFMYGGMSGQEFVNWENRVALTEAEFNEISVRYGLDERLNLRWFQWSHSIVARLRVPLSVAEAQLFVSKWGCLDGCEGDECFESFHVPELDKYEEGVYIFGFAVDIASHWLTNGYGNAYAWVNSMTGETRFEEGGFCLEYGRNLYANIPDSMFPIPMRDGVAIPYDQFLPPGHSWGVSYWFSDISIAEIYMEQLRTVGFDGGASDHSPNFIWSYTRETDGARLIVEMFVSDEDGFTMTMYVNFQWWWL